MQVCRKDTIFPREVYRQTWERLSARLSEREACKAIVGLLALAADGHEAQLATELEQLIELDCRQRRTFRLRLSV